MKVRTFIASVWLDVVSLIIGIVFVVPFMFILLKNRALSRCFRESIWQLSAPKCCAQIRTTSLLKPKMATTLSLSQAPAVPRI